MAKTFGEEWLNSRMKYDLIPGLQMTVDAKLNEGKLSQEEAESCRNAIKNLQSYLMRTENG